MRAHAIAAFLLSVLALPAWAQGKLLLTGGVTPASTALPAVG